MNISSRSAFLTLTCLGFGSALIYVAAQLRFPLLEIYYTPLQNLDRLTGSDPVVGLVLFAAVLLLFLSYGLGALVLRRAQHVSGWTALLVVALPLVFAAILVYVYPTTSLDVYDYLFRGRMAVRYGANNFVQVPADFATDPLMASKPFRFIPWSRAVSAYGPLWEGMSYAAAWFAGERPGPATSGIDPWLGWLMVSYKVLGALGFFVCGAAIWAALDARWRWLGVYLWLWNPLALWESVAAAHNDAWMAAAIVGAVAIGRWHANTQSLRRPQGAFLALTIGGLIKYLALIVGPIMLAAALRVLPTWRQRLKLVTIGALMCGCLVVLAYAPFWQGTATFRNFSDRGSLFYATWLAFLQASLVQHGVLTNEAAQRVVAALGNALVLCGVAWSAWRSWREPNRVATHVLWLLAWFLAVASPWFQPWYVLWALAVVAVQPQRQQAVAATVVLSGTAMLSYLAGSFLLPMLGWPSESAAWNGLLALFIYGPPLIICVLPRRARVLPLLTPHPSSQERGVPR